MDRRSLLKNVFALSAIRVDASAHVSATCSSPIKNEASTLYSGLAGFDYAFGGIEQGTLGTVAGAPYMGKTSVLLELAARVISHYRQSVVFYSAQKPTVYLARKAMQREDITARFCLQSPVGETAAHDAN